jgi:hypothetical protein
MIRVLFRNSNVFNSSPTRFSFSFLTWYDNFLSLGSVFRESMVISTCIGGRKYVIVEEVVGDVELFKVGEDFAEVGR